MSGSSGPGTVRSIFSSARTHEARDVVRLEAHRLGQLVDAGVARRAVEALFAVAVERAALSGDAVAARILEDATAELALAAGTVVRRLRLAGSPYDVVLSGGTFRALPTLERAVAGRLAAPGAAVRPLSEEPARGAVALALEELRRP